ncbi:Tethering factor for nuclear proteasome sts1 [Mycoemilia scoparia]|uniref:Tethering factor for nuclear proteasome STS1 n=1 Tax=Mycoemilia scoparia TaxID=417184 RepID=A0A9W8DM51_9FUNG|nr:Tethering factor for nuclear proteasome sts1 [Mycoemilia scoparia]
MFGQNPWNSPTTVLAPTSHTTNNIAGNRPQWGSAVPNFTSYLASGPNSTNPLNDPGNSGTGFSANNSSSEALGGGLKGHKRKVSIDDASMKGLSPEPQEHQEQQYNQMNNNSNRAFRKHKSLANLRKNRSICFDENMPMPKSRVPNMFSNDFSATNSLTGGANRKRTRMEDARGKGELSLAKLLEPMEQKDLIDIIHTLTEKHPGILQDLRSLLPKPTVTSACRQLEKLERKLQESFPYNKSGVIYDDYTFSRVSPSLRELRDTILMYVDYFTHQGLESNVMRTENYGGEENDNLNPGRNGTLTHPCEWFSLLDSATTVATRMPQWNNEEYDSIRKDVLKQLSDGWLRAIIATCRWVKEGNIVGQYIVAEWERSLSFHARNSGFPNLFQPATHAFNHHILPALGIHHT